MVSSLVFDAELTTRGWPQPVLLKRIDAGPPNMTHSVWNPRVCIA